MIEIPVFMALFKMMMRIRKDVDVVTSEYKDALSDFKLHVARNYASMTYLKDVENRLTNHLLRIEKKLDDVGRIKR
jgi:phenylalanyl-tRNA synthetase alpha subunit